LNQKAARGTDVGKVVEERAGCRRKAVFTGTLKPGKQGADWRHKTGVFAAMLELRSPVSGLMSGKVALFAMKGLKS
jgi:hypothetical protein